MFYLLFYEKTPDYITRQEPLAHLHRAYFENLVSQGLLLGGSMEDPLDGTAILLFNVANEEIVRAFAEGDPYVKEGVVSTWWVRKWDIVVGSQLPSLPL